jgi:tetratricopeptide (TPR) repeat protein
MRAVVLLAAVCGIAAIDRAHAQQSCGDLTNAFGPFDYNDPAARARRSGSESPLEVVERGHFNSDVENLTRGLSSVHVIDDLDYTLRAFPNHHRALYSMARYYLANGTHGRQLGRYTMECWFDRAMRLAPRDGVVNSIYGVYLAKKGDRNEALAQYKRALELVPDFAEAHYNLGLLYVDMKRYDLANEHAQEAYRLGFPLAGLRRRLQSLGAWKPLETSVPTSGQ